GGARRGPGDGAPLSRGGSGGQVDPRFSGNDPREGVSGGAPVETAVRKQPADGPADGSGEKGGGTAPACLHPRRRAGDFGEAPYGIRSPDAGKRRGPSHPIPDGRVGVDRPFEGGFPRAS